MKKVFFLVIGVLILMGLGTLLTYKIQAPHFAHLDWRASRGKPNSNSNRGKNQISKPTLKLPTANHNPLTTSHSIFIPYWSPGISENDQPYDTYYYFGIRPTGEGSIENEVGLQNISLVKKIPEKQKKLVIRMLDATVTESILSSEMVQKTLISQAGNVLSENNFSGIVLDLEVPFTLQANKKDQITKFVQQLCTDIKSHYKTCGMLIYGDFSFRNRPYDLQALGKIADTILLMAYDFHKAGGEPGPNFPLSRRGLGEDGRSPIDYGYDFQAMVQDIKTVVPAEKIEVVFGMYGYDWTLNAQGTPLKSAQALSLKEIKAQISNGKFQITKQSQNSNSKEKSIEYVDDIGRKHIIWYEDEESVDLKTKYLLEQGIGRVSFWAHSYF